MLFDEDKSIGILNCGKNVKFLAEMIVERLTFCNSYRRRDWIPMAASKSLKLIAWEVDWFLSCPRPPACLQPFSKMMMSLPKNRTLEDNTGYSCCDGLLRTTGLFSWRNSGLYQMTTLLSSAHLLFRSTLSKHCTGVLACLLLGSVFIFDSITNNFYALPKEHSYIRDLAKKILL